MSVESSVRLKYNFTDMYWGQIIQNTEVWVYKISLKPIGEEDCSDFLFCMVEYMCFYMLKRWLWSNEVL